MKINRRQFCLAGLAGASLPFIGFGNAGSTQENSLEMEKWMVSPPGVPGRFSKESPYAINTPKGIKCQICPNNCILQEGLESICRTHVVRNGKLYTIAYGNPCSVHTDPVEKKPLFHFLPASRSFSIATAGCNFACLNCQNWEISQVSPGETLNSELFPDRVVAGASKNGCRSIAYTYSEPVAFYEYMFDTARIARANGIKNLMISNGYINDRPLKDLAVYLDGANINLKSFSEEIYARLNGGSLQPVLNTLKVLKEAGVWLEITNLVIPGWTDDFSMIQDMCRWLAANGFTETPLHFSRFHPLHKLTNLPATPLSSLEKAREIAVKSGIKYVYLGNVPGHASENTRCPKCGSIVIERKGFTILANRLDKNRCSSCKQTIAGVWS